VTLPAENQQTVEAALWRCPNWPHPETIACVYCVQTEDARAALRDLIAQAEQRDDLVTLVRVGFLVTVGGERATADIVGEPKLRELLMTILQAKDTEAAIARLDGAR